MKDKDIRFLLRSVSQLSKHVEGLAAEVFVLKRNHEKLRENTKRMAVGVFGDLERSAYGPLDFEVEK